MNLLSGISAGNSTWRKQPYICDTTEEKYDDIENQPKSKQGLSKFISALSRLDENELRFRKKASSLPKRGFAREFWKVYDTRNKEAHSARDWREKDFQEIFSSHLVVYIYVILEYYEELSKALK